MSTKELPARERDDEPALTPKGRATRARVLAAAATLMHDHGVAATSIDDVKREASVSAGQVAHYFGDKHALIKAVIGYQTEETLDSQRPLLDQLDSFERLEAWAELNAAGLEASGCVGGCRIGSLAAQLSESAPDLREDLARGFERWREPIRDGLAAMRDRGELQPTADPETLATAFLAALEGGTLLSQTSRDPAPLRIALDTMLSYVKTLASLVPAR
ncbi:MULTISPECIES: TetR/AcrR family transcriptional regulator [unclassified Rathayibacter]|uniref:TetR/AcrR family transcriptional regulator n=1 Tax=unclassified Rathayibacter TaxID=2609250 RepID=UPI00188BC9E1|nr:MULTISPECIES: TetR/AcrR family transcriptional regulator [unclassified Rathayibacter]MBF4461549.1 TetR/AcrR family transcriptional regulator [Rathayibacter sp. VKM Ac-2879]MBF4502960.1 TetR/AcrR family transcriptional regulator [Rathayibacter sp. VKM Ac-2878]